MASRTLVLIVLAVGAGIAVLLVEPWNESGGSSNAGSAASASGFYPPVDSKAVGMTPEWREFADSVDRICATTFNAAIQSEARVDRFAALKGWSDERAEEVRLGVWNDQAVAILRLTEALGPPPERADLLSRWRDNVGRRLGFRNQARQAAGQGRWRLYRDNMNRIYPLKDRGDRIGQRFGLRICTSN